MPVFKLDFTHYECNTRIKKLAMFAYYALKSISNDYCSVIISEYKNRAIF